MINYIPPSYNYDVEEMVQKLNQQSGNSGRKVRTNRTALWYDVRYVDAWSLGVLVCELIQGGEGPFSVPDEEKEQRKVERGYVSSVEVIFDEIRSVGDFGLPLCISRRSERCVDESEFVSVFDFISSLTCKKPEDRMSMGQGLQHHWITKYKA